MRVCILFLRMIASRYAKPKQFDGTERQLHEKTACDICGLEDKMTDSLSAQKQPLQLSQAIEKYLTQEEGDGCAICKGNKAKEPPSLAAMFDAYDILEKRGESQAVGSLAAAITSDPYDRLREFRSEGLTDIPTIARIVSAIADSVPGYDPDAMPENGTEGISDYDAKEVVEFYEKRMEEPAMLELGIGGPHKSGGLHGKDSLRRHTPGTEALRDTDAANRIRVFKNRVFSLCLDTFLKREVEMTVKEFMSQWTLDKTILHTLQRKINRVFKRIEAPKERLDFLEIILTKSNESSISRTEDWHLLIDAIIQHFRFNDEGWKSDYTLELLAILASGHATSYLITLVDWQVNVTTKISSFSRFYLKKFGALSDEEEENIMKIVEIDDSNAPDPFSYIKYIDKYLIIARWGMRCKELKVVQTRVHPQVTLALKWMNPQLGTKNPEFYDNYRKTVLTKQYEPSLDVFQVIADVVNDWPNSVLDQVKNAITDNYGNHGYLPGFITFVRKDYLKQLNPLELIAKVGLSDMHTPKGEAMSIAVSRALRRRGLINDGNIVEILKLWISFSTDDALMGDVLAYFKDPQLKITRKTGKELIELYELYGPEMSIPIREKFSAIIAQQPDVVASYTTESSTTERGVEDLHITANHKAPPHKAKKQSSHPSIIEYSSYDEDPFDHSGLLHDYFTNDNTGWGKSNNPNAHTAAPRHAASERIPLKKKALPTGVKIDHQQPTEVHPPHMTVNVAHPPKSAEPGIDAHTDQLLGPTKPHVIIKESHPLGLPKPTVAGRTEKPSGSVKPHITVNEKQPESWHEPHAIFNDKQHTGPQAPSITAHMTQSFVPTKSNTAVNEAHHTPLYNTHVVVNEREFPTLNIPNIHVNERKPLNMHEPNIVIHVAQTPGSVKPNVVVNERQPLDMNESNIVIHMDRAPGIIKSDPYINEPELLPLGNPNAIFNGSEPPPLRNTGTVVNEKQFPLINSPGVVMHESHLLPLKSSNIVVNEAQPLLSKSPDMSINESQPPPLRSSEIVINESQPPLLTNPRIVVNRLRPLLSRNPGMSINESQPPPLTNSGMVINESQPPPLKNPGIVVNESQPPPLQSSKIVINESQPPPLKNPGIVVNESQPPPSRNPGIVVNESQPPPSRNPGMVINESQPPPLKNPGIVVNESQPPNVTTLKK